MVNYEFLRNILISKKVLLIINFLLRYFFGHSANINANQIQNKYKKIIDLDEKFVLFNKKLLLHYNKSNKAKEYKKLFNNKR